MSRGPGWIERAIHELFGAHPELAFVTDELAEHCFPDADKIERKHQVSVLRAAHKVVALDPDWTEWRIEYQCKGWVFLNHANVQSYALARLISEQFMPDPDKYLAKLGTDDYRKLIASGRTWARFMQEHCAKRDGDAELAAALRARHDAEMAPRAALSVSVTLPETQISKETPMRLSTTRCGAY